MKKIFDFVYDVLVFLSDLTGFTYKEINIIIWFILIPLSWTFLLDKIFKIHYYKIAFIILLSITLLSIKSFLEFSNWLFDKSADLLRSFDALGSNYTTSSVLICLLLPILIYYFLIKKAYFNKKTNVC